MRLNRKISLWLGWVSAGVGLLIILSLVFLSYRSILFFKNIGVKVKEKVIKKPKQTYTVAMLGYGGKNHEGGYLTDTMIVAHINYKSKKALLVSIPRDLWVKLPTKSKEPFSAKINTVYQLQLFPETFPDVAVKEYTKTDKSGLLKKVLKNITGLDIDAYVAIDFDAFETIIDTLGGVQIEIEHSFEDKEYPIEGKQNDLCGKNEEDLEELEKLATESVLLAFPCRYETINFSAGTNFLNGEEALKFARSRHSEQDGGDFARAKRQQLIIEAVVNKLLSPLYFPKIPGLMDKLETQIETDALYQDLTTVLKQAPQAKQYQLKKLILSTDNLLINDLSADGQYILIPKKGTNDWGKIQTKIKKLTSKAN